MRDAIEELQDEDVGRGSQRREWDFNGYVGEQTDSVRYGLAGGKLLWETSGEVAPYTTDRLRLYGGRCTRLDLQTTLTLSEPLPLFGMRLLRLDPKTPLHLQRSPKTLGQRSDTKGSWCGTVGDRDTPSYWRVYDKGKREKTAPPGYMWRVEWEVKKNLVQPLWEEMLCQMDVTRWCNARLISSWEQEGYSWPWHSDDPALPVVERAARSKTTAVGLAIWASRTVRPVVARLLTTFSVAEVLEMLGLSEVSMPRGRRGAERPGYTGIAPLLDGVAGDDSVPHQGALGQH